MNYEYWMDAPEPFLILKFITESYFRPHVGDIVTIPKKLTPYRITRCEPQNNPDTEAVKYFIMESENKIPGFENSLVQVYEPGIFLPKNDIPIF